MQYNFMMKLRTWPLGPYTATHTNTTVLFYSVPWMKIAWFIFRTKIFSIGFKGKEFHAIKLIFWESLEMFISTIEATYFPYFRLLFFTSHINLKRFLRSNIVILLSKNSILFNYIVDRVWKMNIDVKKKINWFFLKK